MTTPLTWLYVPGDRAERIPKAFVSGADVVIVDLEDAVVPARKADARAAAADHLAGDADGCPAGVGRQVRVNAVGSPWVDADLALVAALPSDVGVRLPKCEQPEMVARVAEAVGRRAVHVLVESARGVEAAFELARAHPQVASVGLGEADLRADLGVADDRGLLWARSRIVVAASAAGLDAPSMSVHPDVKDLDGLRATCEDGKALGFVGRSAIHPVQLDVIREVFLPTEAELARAREVLSAAEAGTVASRGAVALPDGRFVDEAVVRQARRVLGRASGAR